MGRLRGRMSEMWDVEVRAAVGRMTRPGAMLQALYDIISATRYGGAGIESCFGTSGACRKGLDPRLLILYLPSPL